MIEPDHPALPIGMQCRLLSISRSSFYCKRPPGAILAARGARLVMVRHG